MSDGSVTRGEFDMLVKTVEANQMRLNQIDDGGTKGVASLQVQLTEVVKDLAELKISAETWQSTHTTQHMNEAKERAATRRWMVSAVIVPSVLFAGTVAADIILHLHG